MILRHVKFQTLLLKTIDTEQVYTTQMLGKQSNILFNKIFLLRILNNLSTRSESYKHVGVYLIMTSLFERRSICKQIAVDLSDYLN